MPANHLHALRPLLLCTAAAAAAQSGPPPIPTELRARFGFTGPHIVKIGDGITDLRIADIDGDGRAEAVVADPRRARLVALHWQGEKFDTVPIPTDGQIAGFAIAAVRGAGTPDLLLVDGRGRLTVRPLVQPGVQPVNGAATGDGIDLGLGGRDVTLLTKDLDGDGKVDVVAASRGGLRWITKFAGTPVLSPIEPLEENVHDLLLEDFDGDGVADLAMVAPGPAMNLRLRLGRGDGTFGPWLIGNLEGLRHVFRAGTRGKAPLLGTIEGPQQRVALRTFARDGAQAALEWWAADEGQGQANKALPFAVGDFDGDGAEDVVLAQGERARLLFYRWQQHTFVPEVVPTLAGVASIAAGDVDRDGKTDLVFASPEEDALAWKSGARALGAFPERLPCVDKPVAVAVDPQGGVLVIARTDKREAHLDRVVAGAQPVRLVDLGRLPADPARLLIADVGDQDGLEAAFVVPGEGLRVVNLKPGDDNKPSKPSGDVAGFTKKIDDGALGLTTWDGKPALLAVRDRFVRVFRTDAAGQVQVLAQDNGPEGAAELSLASRLPDQSRLYLDKKNRKLLKSSAGAPVTSFDVPPFDFAYLLAHGDAALLLSARGVLRVPFGKGPSLRQVAVHEPPTTRTAYRFGVAGDFDGDGIDDVAVLDGHLPGVQILAGSADGLQRALAIPVFEAPPSEEPGHEPRELAVGDLDGDGRADLVVVAHDRVLIYLQEKP